MKFSTKLEKANYFTVADENGFIKIFTTHPKLMLLKGILFNNLIGYILFI